MYTHKRKSVEEQTKNRRIENVKRYLSVQQPESEHQILRKEIKQARKIIQWAKNQPDQSNYIY